MASLIKYPMRKGGEKSGKKGKKKRSPVLSKKREIRAQWSRVRQNYHALNRKEFEKLHHVIKFSDLDSELYNTIKGFRWHGNFGHGSLRMLPTCITDHISSYLIPQYLQFGSRPELIGEVVRHQQCQTFGRSAAHSVLLHYNVFYGLWNLGNGYLYFRIVSDVPNPFLDPIGKFKDLYDHDIPSEFVFQSVERELMESPYAFSGIVVDCEIIRTLFSMLMDMKIRVLEAITGGPSQYGLMIKTLNSYLALTHSIYHGCSPFRDIDPPEYMSRTGDDDVVYSIENIQTIERYEADGDTVDHDSIVETEFPFDVHFRDLHDIRFRYTGFYRKEPTVEAENPAILPEGWSDHPDPNDDFWSFRDCRMRTKIHTLSFDLTDAEHTWKQFIVWADHKIRTVASSYSSYGFARDDQSYTAYKKFHPCGHSSGHFYHTAPRKTPLSDALSAMIHKSDDSLGIPKEICPSFFRAAILQHLPEY
jgi:hypothetical protein